MYLETRIIHIPFYAENQQLKVFEYEHECLW